MRQRSLEEAQREAEAVNQWIDDQGNSALDQLLPLTEKDLLTMAVVVQLYAFADFNARRALEIIDRVTGSPRQNPSQTPRDGDVMKVLARRLPLLGLPPQEVKRAQTSLGMIDGFFVHRHNFAHWAGRRVPHTDALVLMTKNAREARRRTGATLDDYEMQYVVVPMPEVRANIEILRRNVDWLSERVSIWWRRFLGSSNRESGPSRSS